MTFVPPLGIECRAGWKVVVRMLDGLEGTIAAEPPERSGKRVMNRRLSGH
jgi:hypothetical protein